MSEKSLTNVPVLFANPRLVFQTTTHHITKGYIRKKRQKLKPLDRRKHDITVANPEGGVKMPSWVDKSTIDQTTLLGEYRKIIKSQENFSELNISIRPNREKAVKKEKNLKKTPRQRKLRESEWKKGRPMFTEGLSSRSSQDEPVFYLRNQLFLSSNQPGGVQCVRDKSKLILEATTDSPNKNVPPVRETVSSLSMPKLANAPRWGSKADGVQVTRNNTMLLPKVFVNQELPLIDSESRAPSTRSMMYTPRDVISTDLLPVHEDVTDSLHHMKLSEHQGVSAPVNSPVKPSRGPTDSKDNKTADNPLGNGSVIAMETNDLRSIISSQRGSRRYTEAPSVVSIGHSEDIEFIRGYRPTGKSSIAGVDWSDLETRPSTMESRMALSTPGRKLKPKRPPLDSMSLGVIESRAGTQTKVVISEEENMIHDFVYDSDQKTEAKIPKLMFGDPVKESKKLDKKLNNSKLGDLYQRGIVQSQKAGAPSPRFKTKDDFRRYISGNTGSRTSGYSAMGLANPPPSLATANSSPRYDFRKLKRTGNQVGNQQLNLTDQEGDDHGLSTTDGELTTRLDGDITE